MVIAAAVLAWCLAVGVWIWTTPVRSSGVALTMGPAGTRVVERVEYHSFSEISGFGIAPLVVPVALAACALWVAWRQHVVGLALVALIFIGFCVVAGFSIGGAYVPAAVGLFVATVLGAAGRGRAPECPPVPILPER